MAIYVYVRGQEVICVESNASPVTPPRDGFRLHCRAECFADALLGMADRAISGLAQSVLDDSLLILNHLLDNYRIESLGHNKLCDKLPGFRDFLKGYCDILCATLEDVFPSPGGKNWCDYWCGLGLVTARCDTDTLTKIVADCLRFYAEHFEATRADFEMAGDCLAYSRNGHGTGFFDREDTFGDEACGRLQEAAEAMGESELETFDGGESLTLT